MTYCDRRMFATNATGFGIDLSAGQLDIEWELRIPRYRIWCRISKATRFRKLAVNWNLPTEPW